MIPFTNVIDAEKRTLSCYCGFITSLVEC